MLQKNSLSTSKQFKHKLNTTNERNESERMREMREMRVRE
jgi:hypothetical protein